MYRNWGGLAKIKSLKHNHKEPTQKIQKAIVSTGKSQNTISYNSDKSTFYHLKPELRMHRCSLQFFIINFHIDFLHGVQSQFNFTPRRPIGLYASDRQTTMTLAHQGESRVSFKVYNRIKQLKKGHTKERTGLE